MDTSPAQQQVLRAHGFSYEYPGFWLRTVDGVDITVADGVSCNGELFEVQYQRDGYGLDESEVPAEVANAAHAVECDLADLPQ